MSIIFTYLQKLTHTWLQPIEFYNIKILARLMLTGFSQDGLAVKYFRKNGNV